MMSAGVQDVPESSLTLAQDLANSSQKRIAVPIRLAFVERVDPAAPLEGDADLPPLAQLIRTGGRGGEVATKLYLSLVWRCSATPFTTDISARKWAALLGLEDPAKLGARRVTDALRTLERHQLVHLETRRGEPSIIHLLDEHGDGTPYNLPSTASVAARSRRDPVAAQAARYFKVPTVLWTSGHMQAMSAPAVAMLLVCLASERGKYGEPVWWSTTTFPTRYCLSPSTRSRGTKDLAARELLLVRKELISNSRTSTFGRDQVRNRYQLINEANLADRTAELLTVPKKKVSVRRKTAGTVKGA